MSLPLRRLGRLAVPLFFAVAAVRCGGSNDGDLGLGGQLTAGNASGGSSGSSPSAGGPGKSAGSPTGAAGAAPSGGNAAAGGPPTNAGAGGSPKGGASSGGSGGKKGGGKAGAAGKGGSAQGGGKAGSPSGGADAGGGDAGGAPDTGGTSATGGGTAAGAPDTGGAGARMCCEDDTDCDDVCIEHSCEVSPPDSSSCWSSDDCEDGNFCEHQIICDCNDPACDPSQNRLGDCAPTCCATDKDCDDQVCVGGFCQDPVDSGECWKNDDCGKGTCVGASVCTCGGGAACDPDDDQPGQCAPEGSLACCGLGLGSGCNGGESCEGASGLQKNGQCLKSPGGKDCFSNADCGAFGTCSGATTCACGSTDCVAKLGSCE